MKTKAMIFVIDSLGDGGAEKSVLTLAKGFSDQGYASYVITIRDHVVYNIPKGVAYRTIAFRKGLGIYRILTDLRARKKLKTLIMEINQTHHVLAVISNLIFSDTLLSGLKFDFPVFSIIRNYFTKRYLKKSGIGRQIKLAKLKHTYNRHHLIALSRGIEADLTGTLRITPRSITTINNPFDIRAIQKKAAEPADVCEEEYIIHVGRFVRQKRHDVLLKAFAAAELPCRLVLLADTSCARETQPVRQLAKELGIEGQLVMPGFQKNPYAWIKKARFFVSASDFEGFPRALTEALICGTPVVCTDCPTGPSEILGENSPWLSPVGDIEALAQNMKKLYKTGYFVGPEFYAALSVESIVKKMEVHICGSG